jgi:O-antigen/teichoic acid export membrane protein
VRDEDRILESNNNDGRSSLVRDASGFMAATYVSQVLAFGIGIVTKGLLGPEDLGLWTQLLAVLSFIGLLEFGVIQAANKEIAYALGKGQVVEADLYKRVQFSFVLMTSIFGAICLTAYAFWFGTHSDSFALGLMSVALMLPISQLQLGQVTVYWANGRFGATSLLIVGETLIAGTIGLLLVWRFGVMGQIVSFFLILLAKVWALSWQARDLVGLQISFKWNLMVLKKLLKSGIPLFLISLSNVLKISGTVFLISHYFDTKMVGYYSLALSVQNFIYWTPNAFSVVMFPRFQARYADSNDQAASLSNYLVKPIIGLAFFLLPVLLSATYFFVPPLIEHILPDYRPTIEILFVMLLGTFFLSLEHMPAQFLITINKLWERVIISLFGFVLMAACVAPAAILGGDIIFFVAGLSLANLLGLMIILSYASYHTYGTRSKNWLVFSLLGAFLYLVTVLLVVDHWIPSSNSTWLLAIQFAIVKWLLSLVLLLPLFLVAERNLDLLATIRSLLRQLFARV